MHDIESTPNSNAIDQGWALYSVDDDPIPMVQNAEDLGMGKPDTKDIPEMTSHPQSKQGGSSENLLCGWLSLLGLLLILVMLSGVLVMLVQKT
jgi:hypothetical protein